MKTNKVRFTVEIDAEVAHENYPDQDLSDFQAIMVAKDCVLNAIKTGHFEHQHCDKIKVKLVSCRR